MLHGRVVEVVPLCPLTGASESTGVRGLLVKVPSPTTPRALILSFLIRPCGRRYAWSWVILVAHETQDFSVIWG